MKTCACICEFNPFHTGHKYFFDKIREKGFDKIVCVMSGNFVQRAEPAVADKFSRAASALRNGADAIVELPVPYAISSAQQFALGGIKVIKRLGIEHIAFGVETDDPASLIAAAKIQAEETDDFKSALKSKLDDGMAFPEAITLVMSDILRDFPAIKQDLQKPNNVLAISYLRAINLIGQGISPVFVKRFGNEYNDADLIPGKFPSASALRKAINENRTAEELKDFSDKILLDEIISSKPDISLFEKLIIYKLRQTDISAAANAPDSGEGIETKLIKNAARYVDLDKLIKTVKSKRYTYSRIKRLYLQIMFDINSDIFEKPVTARVLGIKNSATDFLKNLPSGFYVKAKDADKTGGDLIAAEKKADSLYSLLTRQSGNIFYEKKFINM